MRVFFAKHPGVRWRGISLGLICALTVALGRVSAEEAAPAAKVRPAEVAQPPDTGALLRSVGVQTFQILEAVERHHIAAPPREGLWKIVAAELCSPNNQTAIDELARSFGRCETADAFGESFRDLWLSKRWPKTTIVQFPELVVASLNQKFGTVGLVKAKDYAVEEQFRNNRYVGLGVALGIEKGTSYATFPRVIPGGPAERGGLRDGVKVLEVDGRSTKDVELKMLLDWLRGLVGSEVALKILNPGDSTERDVTLTRGVIRFDSVFGVDRIPVSQASFRFDPAEQVGGLTVSSITGSTLQELRDAEVRLRADGIRALILDFQYSERSDEFHQARLLADGLLDGGTLWHWHERDAEPRAETADRECLFRGMPLVVLVGSSTGHAHAAIAAALQDAGRAVIVGQPPPFDGKVTTGIPLPGEQHVLQMHTARLTRSRVDRTWPLKPDHIAGAVAMTRAEQARLAATPQPITVQKAEQYVRRAGGAVVARDESVSALFPQNLTQNEISLRLQQSARESVFRQQQLFPTSNQLPELPLAEARRIARELLKTLPP